MKVRNAIKKIGAITASTLLTGLTLGSAASLADYPGMFLDDSGAPTAKLVVGSSGAVSDVVGGINVAASLGQSTMQSEERTETQSVNVQGAAGWSADDGVTLDSQNDDLYFGDAINSIRKTLTQNDLDLLSEQTFRDDGGTTYDITNYLNIDNQNIQFTAPENDMDPIINVNLPAENGVDNTDYLFSLQANMDEINFTDSDVKGEDIELFGRSYTISNNDNEQGDNEIVLFGSAQEVELETGEESTVTINDNEHTLEVVSVQDSNSAAIRVDGSLRQESLDATFNVDGQDVRIDEIINTGSSDDGNGVVVFAIGSEEIKFEAGSPVQDDEDDDIDGTYVEINGASSHTVGSGVSSIEVFVGSDNDDNDYLEAGDMFSHDLFEQIAVHFGGLNPDAEEGGDDISEIAFSTDGDDTATASITDESGDEAALGYAFSPDPTAGSPAVNLADSDDDRIVIVEGESIKEDEYFLADAGDFAHMWEVTSIDRDDIDGSIPDGEEATIDLRDAVTGQTIEVDLDAADSDDSAADDSGDELYQGTEIIDGQTYHFELEGGNDDFGSAATDEFRVAWGDGADHDSWTTGTAVTVSPALDTESGAAITFANKTTVSDALPTAPSGGDFSSGEAVGTTIEDFADGSFDVDLNISEVRDSSYVNTTIKGTDDAGSGFAAEIAVDSGGATSENTSVNGLTHSFASGNLTLTFTNSTLASEPTPKLSSLQITAAGSSGTVLAGTDADTGSISSVTISDVSTALSKDIIFPSTESTGDIKLTTSDTVSFSGSTPTTVFDLGSSGLQVDIEPNQQLMFTDGTVDADSASSIVIQPEDDNDNEHAYLVKPDIDTGDDEMGVGDSGSIGYTGSTNGASGYNTQTLDSDDDINVAYSTYGTYSEQNTDDQGGVTLNIPSSQAVAGAAVTARDGSINAGGGSSSATAEVTYNGLRNPDIAGNLPNLGMTDAEVTQNDRASNDLILVGGPAVNSLVADLASNGDTWTQQEWADHEDEALLHLVEDAFSDGNHAMIVAGYAAGDTLAAARYISNYAAHQDELEGTSQLTLTQSMYPGQ